MKIKVTVLTEDKEYLDRLSAIFTSKYMDKIEIYSFTDASSALESIEKDRIDVLVIEEKIDLPIDSLKGKCGIAYLVENSGIEKIDEIVAICKYQKAENIYKQILNIYSNVSGAIQKETIKNDKCDIITFSSPCGGMGTSTMAISAAINLQKRGRNVFYLNFETIGTTDFLISGDGQFDMSDVIYTIKCGGNNVALKLESFVRTSIEEISYFAEANLPLDMLELKWKEKKTIIDIIAESGKYDAIVIDNPFELGEEMENVLEISKILIMVSDGTIIANKKISDAYKSMNIYLKNKMLLNKFRVLYNKFSNKTGKMVEEIPIIGGIVRYEGATVQQIIRQAAEMIFWDSIIE